MRYVTDVSHHYVVLPVSDALLRTGGRAMRSLIRKSIRRTLAQHGEVGNLRYLIDPFERHGIIDAPRADGSGFGNTHIVMGSARITYERPLVP